MADYYEVLELQRTATNADIKKAYRKLAMRWHPDKNPQNVEEANRRFKEISQAYEVLIDERTRSIYNQYGIQGLQMFNAERQYRSHFNPHFTNTFVFRNPEEVFREFFGVPSENMFRTPARVSVRLGPIVHVHPINNSIRPPFFGPPGVPPYGFPRIHSSFQAPSGTSGWFNANFSRASSTNVVRQTSISTQFIHGKKITVQRIFENGIEIIMSYENDVLKSKTVNGVPQPITCICHVRQ